MLLFLSYNFSKDLVPDGGSFEILVPKAKKKIVVFQVPCQKKTGSVGRLYFFFFFFFFFFACGTNQFFSFFPL